MAEFALTPRNRISPSVEDADLGAVQQFQALDEALRDIAELCREHVSNFGSKISVAGNPAKEYLEDMLEILRGERVTLALKVANRKPNTEEDAEAAYRILLRFEADTGTFGPEKLIDLVRRSQSPARSF